MGLLNMSFSAVILILAIVIIRVLLLHKLPKRTFLVLWSVALCRLLIPFEVSSRFSIYSVINMLKGSVSGTDSPLAGIPVMLTHTAITETAATLPEAVNANVSPLLIIWFIGFAVCTLFFLVTHLRCRKEYKTALPIDNVFVKRWQQVHPMWRGVQIRQSDLVFAPLTYGIFRPIVLLPKQIDWTDETRLRYILTHEFVHIRRFDTLTKLVLAIALCVHWFNPFVWLMYVLANRDIELSCDEAVVRAFKGNVKSAYALTLIGLEEKKSRFTPLVNNFSKHAIEERIVSIMKIKKRHVLTLILAVVLVSSVTLLFATAADRTEEKGNHTPVNMVDASIDGNALKYANLYIDKILSHLELTGSETDNISSILVTAITNAKSTGLYDYARTHVLSGNTEDDIRILLKYESFELVPALSVVLKESSHDARGQIIAAVYQEYASAMEKNHPVEYESMITHLEHWRNK
ncbi:M56 family metallopeptidase [Paenibacillus koleovorans]|uniref:M56 family metallopeptidase n=1 Tax=Paenibacillus koleovorans TaxID=121608 RepID=UPI0013E3A3CD|nr:M56 family metallopeptidase [Paenibacillus koleovorans]